MSSLDLPASHLRFVFAGLLHRAGLITWNDFVEELCGAFGPVCGAAIARHLVVWRDSSVTSQDPRAPVWDVEQ